MGLTDIFSKGEKEKLRLGDGIALWNVARYKVTGLPVLSIFYKQCEDEELKKLIHSGVFKMILPHVEKIQKLLKDEGIDSPSEPNWDERFEDKEIKIEANALITDEEIAISLREILRAGMLIESSSIMNAAREDVKKMLDSVYDDDIQMLNKLSEFQKQKNWFEPTPYLNS